MENIKLAENIVGKILYNLRGRAGVGDELENIDSETYDELQKTLSEIVQKELELVIL
jgi:hypothetical protein